MEHPHVVAVPGLGLGADAWLPTLERWAVTHEVRLLPGYGLPLDGRGPRTPYDAALELGDQLQVRSVLLGHSSSCQVVAHVARARPDLVSALVLVGPATDPRLRTWPRLASAWLRTAAHEDPRQVPGLVRQYRRTTLRAMLTTMDRARHDDLAATLAEVACPVVLVRGGRDRISRGDWLRVLARTGPARRVTELEVGAHMVPLTHPDLLAAAVDAL